MRRGFSTRPAILAPVFPPILTPDSFAGHRPRVAADDERPSTVAGVRIARRTSAK
jgi:hypothetical protein